MKKNKQVVNCSIIKKPCPLSWDKLKATSETDTRFCDQCEKKVYFCNDDKEAIKHAKQNHCIAISTVCRSGFPELVLGSPGDDLNPVTEEQLNVLKESHIETEKVRALKDIKYADRSCETCGYPIAEWRKSCWVCNCKTKKL
jgi:hypothetical protein